jgi:hypothetical protein
MSMREHRTITSNRSDLTTVRNAALLRRVDVRGPGIRSIRGIERRQLLDGVTLSGLESPELELLTRLPRLKSLELNRVRGAVDWAVLGRVLPLERLDVNIDDARQLEQLRDVSLARLERLGWICVRVEPDAAGLAGSWIASAPAVRAVAVLGASIGDDLIEALLQRRSSMEIADLDLATREQILELRRGGVNATSLAGDDRLGAIAQFVGPTGESFSLGLNLASRFGLETNYDAEERLIASLRAARPELLEVLEFDTEAGAVWMNSTSHDALREVFAFLEPDATS